MQKKELIHLHTLLRTVASDLHDADELDAAALDEYESLGITPMSLRSPRDDHETAVLTLADAIGTCLDASDATDATDANDPGDAGDVVSAVGTDGVDAADATDDASAETATEEAAAGEAMPPESV